MRDAGDAKQSFQGGAFFRSVGKTYGFSNSTRRKRPPQSDGFEAILGTETSPCTRCWQKSAFGNVLPTEGGEHIFIKFAKQKLKKNHAKTNQKQKSSTKLQR